MYPVGTRVKGGPVSRGWRVVKRGPSKELLKKLKFKVGWGKDWRPGGSGKKKSGPVVGNGQRNQKGQREKDLYQTYWQTN